MLTCACPAVIVRMLCSCAIRKDRLDGGPLLLFGGMIYHKRSGSRVVRLRHWNVIEGRDALLQRVQRGLGAASELQLAEDVADVGANGQFANNQLCCNVFVAAALCNEPQYIQLTLRQRVFGQGLLFFRRMGEFEKHFAGNGWLQRRLTPIHLAYGSHQFFWARIFQKIAKCACFNRREDILIGSEAGQDENARARQAGRYLCIASPKIGSPPLLVNPLACL
jgi:hypothetical protein